MSGGPEPGGHVNGVGGGQLETAAGRVQVHRQRVEERVLGLLSELENRRKDGVLASLRNKKENMKSWSLMAKQAAAPVVVLLRECAGGSGRS